MRRYQWHLNDAEHANLIGYLTAFPVLQALYLGKGVDQVRSDEHRQLLKASDQHLKGTKHQWQRNPANMSWHQRRASTSLRNSALKTSHAWAMKDLAAQRWHY